VTDQTVQLRYLPGSEIERLPSAQAVSIFRFADRRGDEGDGNPRRVGGIYGSYGNRVAMVFAATRGPKSSWRIWPRASHSVGRGRRGDGSGVRPRETVVSTPFALGGEIRNFSTEMRWTLQSHVSGIIRLTTRRERCYSRRRSPPNTRDDSATSGTSRRASTKTS